MSSDDHKSHVLMIFNQLTSYVEDVLKSYILNEILLVAISILKSSLRIGGQGGLGWGCKSIRRSDNSVIKILTNQKIG